MEQDDQDNFIILPQLTEEEQKQFQKENSQRIHHFYKLTQRYQMEYWYPKLQSFTFSSFSFSLSSLEAYIIHRLYYSYQLTQVQQAARNTLENKIDLFLQHKFKGQPCFMKLSTRSPKDYCWDYRDEKDSQSLTQQLTQFLKQSIKEQLTQLSSENLNSIYKFLLMNSRRKLMIKNGKDFVNIFSKSQRIVIDLYDFSLMKNNIFEQFKKGNYEQSHQPLISVWGRQWMDYQWFQEMRCFYSNYKLTGISQYDQRCFFSELVNKQSQILKIIQQFFEKLKPELLNLQLSQGVMDIVVKGLQNPTLVQINVFNQNTRASLFSWQKDLQQLKDGPQIQVRLLKQTKVTRVHIESMMGMIDKDISKAINKAFSNLNLSYLWPIIQ